MTKQTCTDDDNCTSAKDCERERPNSLYAADVPVYFEARDGDQVTIRAKASGSNVNAKGSPPLKTNPIKWDDKRLWTRCPSRIELAGDGLPAVGTEGTLYLSSDLVDANNLNYRPKWPIEAGDDATNYGSMRVYPTRITLFGHEMHTGRSKEVTIELFNDKQTDQAQELTIKHGVMSIRVAEHIFQDLGIGSPNMRQLEAAKDTIEHLASTPEDIAGAWLVVSRWSRRLEHADDFERASEEFRQAKSMIDLIARARNSRIRQLSGRRRRLGPSASRRLFPSAMSGRIVSEAL